MIAIERITGVDGEHRFGFQVFAPLQKLQQAHAVGRTIAPGTRVAGTIFNRAERLLPREAVFDFVAFNIIAAGKRRNFGCTSTSICHDVCAQLPLGRSFYVGGNSETRPSQTVPG